MNVYVASSVKNKEEVRVVQQLLRDAGHTISHDWTQVDGEAIRMLGGAAKTAALIKCQDDDRRGIHEADAVVVLNHPASCATHAELGFALAWDKVVIAQNAFVDGWPYDIFFNDPNIMHARDHAHIVELVNYASRHRRLQTRTTVVVEDTFARLNDLQTKG